MDRAALRIASGLLGDGRRWWVLTGLALAGVLALSVLAAGVLEGMDRETERRIGDAYTGDQRLTLGVGTSPAGRMDLAHNSTLRALQQSLSDQGVHLEGRVETNIVLVRDSLVAAYLTQQDYTVALNGEGAGDDFSAALLLGLPPGGLGVERMRPYLVAGRFPDGSAPGGAIELMLSAPAFTSLLPAEGRAALDAGASLASLLGTLPFEVTAGHATGGFLGKDVIRAPATVVGLFETRIEILDRLTVLSSLADAQRLLGRPADGPVNVLVAAGSPSVAQQAGREAGLQTADAHAFAGPYVGQFVQVLRALALAVTGLLLAFPVLLLWYGIVQQLDKARREFAVGRAIGVPQRTLATALAILACLVMGAAAAVATLLVVGLGAWLGATLPGWRALPLPVAFAVPRWMIFSLAVLLPVVAALAVLGTLGRVRRLDLAATLRA